MRVAIATDKMQNMAKKNHPSIFFALMLRNKIGDLMALRQFG
jgi:hypothetical protein